ncbi:MAG TPA: methyltransferase domain-containing protein, partial [Polyangiaceae bacterium]|nr:methyltransferase domain-containing protein [Polyangiaceae bacterium]
MSRCHVCAGPLHPGFALGRMPLGNGFLRPEQLPSEYFFELAVAPCPECKLVQLENTVERERMFHEQYAYYSSTSRVMSEHFGEFARQVCATLRLREHPASGPLVVEIGSNDGIFLQHVQAAGVRHLGVEPSANVGAVARERGIETWTEFFDAAVARRISESFGKAHAIVAANVMCHIPYVDSVLEGVRGLLERDGVFVFEDPYLPDILLNNAVDQIYDEHTFYFSLH